MKSTFLAVLLLPTVLVAQEEAPLEKAREIAGQLGRLYGELQGAVFTSQPDVRRPHAVSSGDIAMVVIPEVGLTKDRLEEIDDTLIPLGVIWFRGLLPASDSFGSVDVGQVRSITITDGKEQTVVHPFHLGMRRGQRGRPQLELYGRGGQPLVTSRMLPLPAKHAVPIELSAYGGDGQGAIMLVSLLGRFQGEVPIHQHAAEPAEKAIVLRSLADAGKAVQAGHVVMPHLNDFPAAPVKVVGQPDQAVLFEAGDSAALLVPHAKTDLANLQPGEVVPLGQLWLKDLLPEVNGRIARVGEVKAAHVESGGKRLVLPQFLLTARRSEQGGLLMDVYSARQKALLTAALRPTSRRQEKPVEIEGRQSGERQGILTISVGGTHAAEIPVRPTR